MSSFQTPFPRIVVLSEHEKANRFAQIKAARGRNLGLPSPAHSNEWLPLRPSAEQLEALGVKQRIGEDFEAWHRRAVQTLEKEDHERIAKLVVFRLDWSLTESKRKAEIAEPYASLFDKIIFAVEPEQLLNLGHLEGLYRSVERTNPIWHGDSVMQESTADIIVSHVKAYFQTLFDCVESAVYSEETTLLTKIAPAIATYRFLFARHPKSAFDLAIAPLRERIARRPEAYAAEADFLTRMVQIHAANMEKLTIGRALWTAPTAKPASPVENILPLLDATARCINFTGDIKELGKKVASALGFDLDEVVNIINQDAAARPAQVGTPLPATPLKVSPEQPPQDLKERIEELKDRHIAELQKLQKEFAQNAKQ